MSRVRGQIKGQLIGVQRLPGLAVAAVHVAPAVLAVPQQRAAQVRHGGADLMGAAGLQPDLHQAQFPPALQHLIVGDGGLAAGDRLVVHGDLLFLLVLQQEALHPALRPLRAPHGDAQVALVQLPAADLLVDDAQRLGVLGGDDDAPGVAVDAIAQGRGEGVLPPGVPLPFLVQVRLDVVDECVDLLRLVGVDHQALGLVRQQQVLILVDHGEPGLEEGQEHILLGRLVKELVVDV